MRVAPKTLAAGVVRTVRSHGGRRAIADLPEVAEVAVAAPLIAVPDLYVRSAPTPQLAIDLFAGEWSSALPDRLGAAAGPIHLFADDRIDWLLAQAGDVKGWRVLELGPLEGGHTYQLSNAGARVTAIESNARAYLKCLVAKELLGTADSQFLFGDFGSYLDANPAERFDLVLASGVLYHATDPLRLLEQLSYAGDRLALWTHFYDPDMFTSAPHLEQNFGNDPVTRSFRGRTVTLHQRDYHDAAATISGFCGGPEEYACWMERGDLLEVLGLLGYDDVRLGVEDRAHPSGPCILVYAERTSTRMQ